MVILAISLLPFITGFSSAKNVFNRFKDLTITVQYMINMYWLKLIQFKLPNSYEIHFKVICNERKSITIARKTYVLNRNIL